MLRTPHHHSTTRKQSSAASRTDRFVQNTAFVTSGTAATVVLLAAFTSFAGTYSIQHGNNDDMPLIRRRAAVLVLGNRQSLLLSSSTTTVRCDSSAALLHEFDEEYPTGYTETERFLQILEYHQSLLFDYRRRWLESATSGGSGMDWPKHVPDAVDVPALEMDLLFCGRSPKYRNNSRSCQDVQFRIASYYLTQKERPDLQTKGYKLVKDLAEHGHADGMCLYGTYKFIGRIHPVLRCRRIEALTSSLVLNTSYHSERRPRSRRRC